MLTTKIKKLLNNNDDSDILTYFYNISSTLSTVSTKQESPGSPENRLFSYDFFYAIISTSKIKTAILHIADYSLHNSCQRLQALLTC